MAQRSKKYEYDYEYNKKNTVLIHISFNRSNPEDEEMREFLQSMPKGSRNKFLKQCVAMAMAQKPVEA